MKNQYIFFGRGGICLKGELGQFVDLRGDLAKKRNGVFEGV